MDPVQDDRIHRNWLLANLAAWGLISALLFARACVYWEGRNELGLTTIAATVGGGVLAVIAVALPSRVILNLWHPGRRRARLRETILCVVVLVLAANAFYLLVVSMPPDW